ncbi:CARDB domain-containing protein [Flavilitoribacter nigricans]|uniref:CARDB domain-containing protein n=1 Tax=Flavilitoribacter nigricans (strain ATCC 23147 / DSM 23189 / NBRC 102662 / NCIMB 1420 / SS-2) TaxID=1122177 RepID=A0A2D0N6I1_FLAN2|nr:CARDB domain-containing protein [Flavilitoribacter nigricans]PHN03759.1 hypothetical protein CRP01_24730 [Flavilitoribacter nigricans DSM 23189 = NBRC 102662]
MKQYAFFLFAFLLTSTGFAQRQAARVQVQQQPTLMQHAANRQVIKAIAADLLPHPPAILGSGGKRYIKAFTVNQGKSKSKACYLKVTYKWKYDYELFTQKELVKTYSIQALDPNEATSVIFEVPDNQIKSNPTFGSKYVSIKLEVDGTHIVFEQDENNNIKQLSLPIIH